MKFCVFKYTNYFESTLGCYKPFDSHSTGIEVYSIQYNSDSTQTKRDPGFESAAFHVTDSNTDSTQTDFGSNSCTLIAFHFIAKWYE